jgi:hypothetical protein
MIPERDAVPGRQVKNCTQEGISKRRLFTEVSANVQSPVSSDWRRLRNSPNDYLVFRLFVAGFSMGRCGVCASAKLANLLKSANSKSATERQVMPILSRDIPYRRMGCKVPDTLPDGEDFLMLDGMIFDYKTGISLRVSNSTTSRVMDFVLGLRQN